ncbi:MAG TPA: NUDIX domain-containing protein [Pseudonocardiaceae bacterium]|nr:NUDIX domain-containing protein [Pseudonocardiaceae bacterium]
MVAVTAFVVDERQRIPGGAQEIGETIGAAVVREVLEKTEIDVEPTGIIGVYSDPDHVVAFSDGEARQEFSICFRTAAHRARLRRWHPALLGGEPRAAEDRVGPANPAARPHRSDLGISRWPRRGRARTHQGLPGPPRRATRVVRTQRPRPPPRR